MSTIELKDKLKSKIDEIEDEALLFAIHTILESNSKSQSYFDEVIYLSEQQKKELQISKNEYLKGNFIDNDVLNEELQVWLRDE